MNINLWTNGKFPLTCWWVTLDTSFRRHFILRKLHSFFKVEADSIIILTSPCPTLLLAVRVSLISSRRSSTAGKGRLSRTDIRHKSGIKVFLFVTAFWIFSASTTVPGSRKVPPSRRRFLILSSLSHSLWTSFMSQGGPFLATSAGVFLLSLLRAMPAEPTPWAKNYLHNMHAIDVVFHNFRIRTVPHAISLSGFLMAILCFAGLWHCWVFRGPRQTWKVELPWPWLNQSGQPKWPTKR